MLESRHCGSRWRSDEIGRRKGLKILTRGLLKSLTVFAFPLSFQAIRSLTHSVLFGSLCH
jgi:hypothetical protein